MGLHPKEDEPELPLLIERASVPTEIPDLHLLSAESIVPARRGRMGLERVAEAAAAATARYELVVLDLPPAGERSAAIYLAGLLDGVLLVVEAEGVSWEAAGRMQQLLGRAGAKVLGAILNKRRHYAPDWYGEEEWPGA